VANKSFVVQYLIKARDHFSAAADKTRKSSKKMREELTRVKKTSTELSAKSVILKNKIRAIVPSMSALNDQGLRLKATLKGIENRFEGISFIGKKIRNTGAMMSAFVTLPAALMARSLKDAARDAIETRSKFATVFKDIGPGAEKMADMLANSYGIAGTKSRELMGDTGDILTGFGFTQKSALDLSRQVNELAVDLASFTNFEGGAEGASKALTKALLGERESVKSLGIAILEKDVKTKVSQLLAKGQHFGSMRQAKAYATLAIAVEQSKNAIGDFARTQEQLANQERITSSRMQDLKESFGRLLLPVALKITQAIRGVAVWLTALSPGAKKVILVIGALIAILGPLLLILGSLILIWPILVAGFATFGAAALAALAPIAPIALAIAYAAAFIIANWDKVSAFFSGFASGISSTFGPTISHLVAKFSEAASIIAGLFSSDSDAAKSLTEFSNLGELVGAIIGGTLDVILRGLAGVGMIIGQVIGAVTTMDFSQFDIEAIKAEFLGAKAEPLLAQTRVDVGVNVGLDQGLAQMGAASIAGPGARRADVGAMAR
jgi:hypothetical protein